MCKESQSPNPENAVPVTACRSKNANPSPYCLWPMTSLGGTAWGFHGGMRHWEDACPSTQHAPTAMLNMTKMLLPKRRPWTQRLLFKPCYITAQKGVTNRWGELVTAAAVRCSILPLDKAVGTVPCRAACSPLFS